MTQSDRDPDFVAEASADPASMLPADLRRAVFGGGPQQGVSGWIGVDQPRIDAFADVTQDRQFIHVDPERAATEDGFGGTIAHGFLTTGLLSAMFYDALPQLVGGGRSVNYGFDRLRFPTPVPAGARLRGHFALHRAEPAAGDAATLHWDVAVEIENGARPALVARWITRLYPAGTGES